MDSTEKLYHDLGDRVCREVGNFVFFCETVANID